MPEENLGFHKKKKKGYFILWPLVCTYVHIVVICLYFLFLFNSRYIVSSWKGDANVSNFMQRSNFCLVYRFIKCKNIYKLPCFLECISLQGWKQKPIRNIVGEVYWKFAGSQKGFWENWFQVVNLIKINLLETIWYFQGVSLLVYYYNDYFRYLNFQKSLKIFIDFNIQTIIYVLNHVGRE